MKGFNEGIKAIEDATESPKDLRSIADYIEKGASGKSQQYPGNPSAKKNINFYKQLSLFDL
jgi:23S rRNA A2030 N6-methylase RlmJ